MGDNGAGMAPEQLKHIFQAFISSKGQGGTGLGLAVVHKIVTEHDGKVEVTSTVGEGTTFTIRLSTQVSEITDSAGTMGPDTKGDTKV